MEVFDNKVDKKRPIPKVKRPSGAVDDTCDIGAYILEFASPSEPSRSQNKKRKKPNRDGTEQRTMIETLRQIGCPLVGLRGLKILPLAPSCARLDLAKRNPKQHFGSKKVSVD